MPVYPENTNIDASPDHEEALTAVRKNHGSSNAAARGLKASQKTVARRMIDLRLEKFEVRMPPHVKWALSQMTPEQWDELESVAYEMAVGSIQMSRDEALQHLSSGLGRPVSQTDIDWYNRWCDEVAEPSGFSFDRLEDL